MPITVYTFDRGKIIEKQCDELGWPNATHDGEIMYDNTHSMDRDQVVQWAKDDLRSAIKFAKDQLGRLRAEITKTEISLAESETALSELEETEGKP